MIASNASQAKMMREPRGMSVPCEAVGVAVAVPALVAGAHEPRNRLERRRSGEDALAEDRVAAHERPLALVERAGLREDRFGYRRLADVVHLGGAHELVELLGLEAHPPPDRERERSDAAEVIGERRQACPEDLEQHPAQLMLDADGPGLLVGVQPAIGELQGARGVGGVERQRAQPVGSRDLEAVPALAERRHGRRDQRLGRDTRRATAARRTRRRPSGRRARRAPAAAASLRTEAPEQHVAGGMAEAVVVELEAVEVVENQQAGASAAWRARGRSSRSSTACGGSTAP